MKLLPKEYEKCIKLKIKDKNIDKLKNVELYDIKLNNKTRIGNNPTYYIYTNLDIINDEIISLIKKIFEIECEEKREFLVGDKKIIMTFILLNQISLITGNYID